MVFRKVYLALNIFAQLSCGNRDYNATFVNGITILFGKIQSSFTVIFPFIDN